MVSDSGYALLGIRSALLLPDIRWYTCARVGGMQMRQISMPDTARFNTYRFRGVRWAWVPGQQFMCDAFNNVYTRKTHTLFKENK